MASIGGLTSLTGLGMQAIGAAINVGRTGWNGLKNAAVQAAATALDAVVDHYFPNLPDVLSAFGGNPIDKGADAIGKRFGSCP